MKKTRSGQNLIGFLLLLALAACAGTSDLARQGDALKAQGNDTGAAGLYEQAIRQAPDDLAARQGLAVILEAHGDYAGAAGQYQQALSLQPDNADLLRGYGRVLLKQGKPADAKDVYEKALRQDSGDVKALNGLGIALDTMGNHVGAQQAYKTALDHDSDDLVTLNNLGRSYTMSGAYGDTIRVLEPHARDKQAPPALRQNLAEAYALSGMDADAERMARMDLGGAALKQKLAAWQVERDKVAPAPRFYADLGRFPTAATAQAKLDAIKTAFPRETEKLVLTVTPDVKTIGGVPHFAARATGFVHGETLRNFCAQLKTAAIACQPHGL